MNNKNLWRLSAYICGQILSMRIQFEKWFENGHYSEDVEHLLRTAIKCYKAEAYTASLLMSYLGFLVILKQRLIQANKPINLSKITIEGGMASLLYKLRKHYDISFTPANADVDPLLREIKSAVIKTDLEYFWEQALGISLHLFSA